MNPSQQQLEKIVAYLDGELPPEESAQVEQQLASDEQFRQQLQGAERAWKALDELPMATVGDEFSRTTMEMVVDAARQDLEAKTIAMPVQRRKRRTTTALLVAMTVLFGAMVARVILQNPNRRLLADLPVIQNVDIYSQFHSVEFLQQLHSQLGDDLESTPAQAEQLQTKVEELLTVTEEKNREVWLAVLSEEEKVTLRSKLNRFRDLSNDRRDEMRMLHDQLQATENREQLIQTMFRYQQWLTELPSSEQFKYRDPALSASDRARRAASEMKQAVNEQAFDLTPEQLRVLYRNVQPFIRDMMERNKKAYEMYVASRSERDRRRIDSMPMQDRMRRVFIYSMGKAPSQFDEFNSAIIKALPEEVGQAFQELSPKEKIYRLHSWIDEFYALSAEGMRSREIPEQELAHFFAEELEPAVRERLLALPREEMQQELQRLYKGQRSKRWREMFRDRADRNQAPAGPPSEDRRRGGRRGGPGPQGRGERGGPWFDGPSGRPQRGPGRDPQQERQPRRPPPPSVDRPSPDEQ